MGLVELVVVEVTSSKMDTSVVAVQQNGQVKPG